MNDAINGLFEFGMACALLVSVFRLHRDKRINGWSIWSVLWPTAWGFWNLYYYPSLRQWASFAGGLCVVLVNSAWVAMALHYSRRRGSEAPSA